MNALFERLQYQAQTNPNAIAIRSEAKQLSYAELVRLVQLRTQQLHQQSQQIFLLDVSEPMTWVIEDLALMLANKVCIPVPPFFSQRQQQYLQQQANSAKPLPPATSKVTFTSGSTGDPKGVCLSVENQLTTVAALAERVAGADVKRHLVIMPLAVLLENVAGVYLALWLGAEVVLLSSETLGLKGSSSLQLESFFAALKQYQPDSLILTPAWLDAVVTGVERGFINAKSFKLLAVGGARLSRTLEHRALALKLPIVQGYGLSEFGSVVALNAPESIAPGTVGKPLSHAQVTLNNGELVVQGNAMLGYWNDQSSWFPTQIYTGDLGEFDDRGRLTILGRRKHIIVTDYGRNIDPEWIESELCSQPGIYQSAVIGDEQMPLTALLVLMPSTTKAQVDAAVDRVNRLLPDYARVKRQIELTEPFTVTNGLLTGTGRLRRQALQRLAQQLFGAQHNSSINEVRDEIF